MRDFQRSRVYRWEKEVLFQHPNNWRLDTLDECRVLVEKVWLGTGVRKRIPKLGDGRRRVKPASFGGEIRLPRGGDFKNPESNYLRTAVIICHEVAHELLPRDVHHGEDFVSTYINLLNTNLNISKDAMIDTAMDFKVKINHDLL